MERNQGHPGRVIEQQSLLGGIDPVTPAVRRGTGRTVHVESRWKVGFAAALALVVEHGKKAQERAEMPPRARCPRCQRLGDTVRGTLVSAWCAAGGFPSPGAEAAGPRTVPAGRRARPTCSPPVPPEVRASRSATAGPR